MTIQARPAPSVDIAERSQVLGRAFSDDPVTAWMSLGAKAPIGHASGWRTARKIRLFKMPRRVMPVPARSD